MLLSGAPSAEFVEVDVAGVPIGYNTFDLQVTATSDWISAALLLTLTQGDIYQHHLGTNLPSNPALFAVFPDLEFDTAVGGDLQIPGIAGGAGDLGGGPLHFDTQVLDVSWYNSRNDDTGTFTIARITISEDAVGTWSYITLGGQASDSGTITAGSPLDAPTGPAPNPSPRPSDDVTGDFNGDDRPDILWRNTATGETRVWTMNGKTFQSSADLQNANTNTDWRPVGAADFTGDGKTDTLWRNTADGRIYIEQTDGLVGGQRYDLNTVANLGWQVAGVDDFTGDGETDILWRHARNGRNLVWEMDGTDYVDKHAVRRLKNTDWRIGGTGDFNADGQADILWRNTTTGRNTIWHMDGTDYRNSMGVKRVKNLAWQIADVADYTNDGWTDILWRNTATGATTIWQMDASAFFSAHALPDEPDQDWQIAGPMLGLWEA